ADARRARARQLCHGRKDTDGVVVRAVAGGNDEGGLREVKLTCDALHALGVQPVRLSKDRERVAAKWTIGKHVDALVFVDSRDHLAALIAWCGARACLRGAASPRRAKLPHKCSGCT